MFDKLKLKLITINMVLLSTVFSGLFRVIFFITSNNINREIFGNLDALIHRNNKMPIPHSINILVDLSNDKSIKTIIKNYEVNIDNDTLQRVVNKIVDDTKNFGKVDISNNSFSYLSFTSSFLTSKPANVWSMENSSHNRSISSIACCFFLFDTCPRTARINIFFGEAAKSTNYRSCVR